MNNHCNHNSLQGHVQMDPWPVLSEASQAIPSMDHSVSMSFDLSIFMLNVLMGPVMSRLQKCRATPHGSDTWHGTWGGAPIMGPLSPGSPMPKSLEWSSPLFSAENDWHFKSATVAQMWGTEVPLFIVKAIYCSFNVVWNEWRKGYLSIPRCDEDSSMYIYIYTYCNSYKYMICYT